NYKLITFTTRRSSDLQLDIASEYLVMATTLLAIKSDMLLPKKEVTYEDEYVEDPREELIERLIEYRKHKEIAYELKDKELNDNQDRKSTRLNSSHVSI